MNPILIEGLAAATYLAVVLMVWHPAARGSARLALLAPLALHGLALVLRIGAPGALHAGFAQALSITLWLATLIYWVESLVLRMDGVLALLLPLAALAALLPAAFPGFALAGEASLALRLHLTSAMAAYSLFTIAALQALFMSLLERRLHQGALSGLFAQVPPLLTLERALFRMIGAGLLLLTAVLVSGFMFSEAVFGRAFRLDHKTLFAIAAWALFAALLIGRWQLGWRGRQALRWLLAGFACLLLAYVGSRFVLEVILGRPPL
jgi:ABC-type uncharacterized transport system permease subunit